MLNYDKDRIKYPVIYDNKFGITDLNKWSDMATVFSTIRHLDVFAKTCNKWLWLESKSEGGFRTENVLIKEQNRNELFKV